MYNIEYFNNMVNGIKTRYINVPIEVMIAANKKLPACKRKYSKVLIGLSKNSLSI